MSRFISFILSVTLLAVALLSHEGVLWFLFGTSLLFSVAGLGAGFSSVQTYVLQKHKTRLLQARQSELHEIFSRVARLASLDDFTIGDDLDLSGEWSGMDVLLKFQVVDGLYATRYSLSSRGQLSEHLFIASIEDANRFHPQGDVRISTLGMRDLAEWEPYLDLDPQKPMISYKWQVERNVHVEGPEALVLAIFQGRHREDLFRWFQLGFVASHGGIEYDERGLSRDVRRLHFKLAGLLKVAGALRLQPEQIPQRLAENVEGEELAIALRSLELLQKQYPDHPLTCQCSAQALESSEPHMRLLGALYVAPQTLEPLMDFLRPNQSQIPASLQLHALRSLLEHKQPQELLVPLFEHPQEELAIEALRLFKRYPLPNGKGLLLECIERYKEQQRWGRMSVALLSLSDYCDVSMEEQMHQMLRWDREIQLSIVSILGLHGTPRSLPVLQRTLALWPQREEHIQQAIDDIKSRAGERGVGGLSMAEVGPGDGQLSVAQEDGGELSLPEQ